MIAILAVSFTSRFEPKSPFAQSAFVLVSALKGLRITAQGQPSPSEATLGSAASRRETQHSVAHSVYQQRLQQAPAHDCGVQVFTASKISDSKPQPHAAFLCKEPM